MAPETRNELMLLKAFESALREGLLLDQALGGVIEAALPYFEASVAALLPAGGAPALARTGRSSASAAEARLCLHLSGILSQGRVQDVFESGLTYSGAPVKVKDQVVGAFGVATTQYEESSGRVEAVRLFARTLSHVLERDRTLATLLKRREEAAALFDLAAGALHSLDAYEVIQLTVTSLSRELDFESVKAYRYDSSSDEIDEIVIHGDNHPGVTMRPLQSEEILVRCLAALGPVFDDDEASGGVGRQRRRMALPIQAGEHVFGFLVMSRRGSFVLSAQEMHLAKELAKITAGALDRSRLIEAERSTAEQLALAGELRSSLSGLSGVVPVIERAVKELGEHFDLDLCTVQLQPQGDLPGASASYERPGFDLAELGGEIPSALQSSLTEPGSHVFLADIRENPLGRTLVPGSARLPTSQSPISLLAVPVLIQDVAVGVMVGVFEGRPRSFGDAALLAFRSLAVELALAVGSARLLEREHESVRFLERLRELSRPLATTFDAIRIKQILCEQALSLFDASSAQFWESDSRGRELLVAARAGGGEFSPPLAVSAGEKHPVVRAFREQAPVVSEEPATTSGEIAEPGVRFAVVPLGFDDERIGLLSVARGLDRGAFAVTVGERLALLAERGAVALHNAKLVKVIESQTERDSQTGLANRTGMLRRLESEIRRAERGGRALSLAHLRLHGLNEARMEREKKPGEPLLPKVASQLVWSTRAMNIVARDRADRFWVLFFEANKLQAKRATQVLKETFERNMPGLKVTTGIASYPEDAFDVATLLLRAELALEEASGVGPGSLVLFGATSEVDVAAVPEP